MDDERRAFGESAEGTDSGAVEGNLDPVTMQSSDSTVRWETPPFRALTATAANERRGHPAPAQEGGYFLPLHWTRRERPSLSEDVGLWKEGLRSSVL